MRNYDEADIDFLRQEIDSYGERASYYSRKWMQAVEERDRWMRKAIKSNLRAYDCLNWLKHVIALVLEKRFEEAFTFCSEMQGKLNMFFEDDEDYED